MDHEWDDISYLKSGSDRQRQAYDTLQEIGIFDYLADYHPVLAGTIPIHIDLPESDLDIICKMDDISSFRDLIFRLFSGYDDFHEKISGDTFIANFTSNHFRIEIFARPVPVKEQEAYRHMIVEYRLLKLLGESFREAVIKVKSDGMKTEPAFCKVLQIEGNPYRSILELASFSDHELSLMFGDKITNSHA
ncbi:MAG: DUF4269 domain-containing protein [Bacteroidales bacterium]|jgi:hypothetical protein|nr:DUF4269 domain-containing protein [Bacteroidales bacterium]